MDDPREVKMNKKNLSSTAEKTGDAAGRNSGNRVDGLRPDAPELAAPGPYAIGVRTLQLLHQDQVDILNVVPGKPLPCYDRPLTVEIWYPSNSEKRGGVYENVYIRDGRTQVSLYGQAVRDADPVETDRPLPLIIISHGYPGNRFLLSHLGEKLASHGYVAIAVDHTDSNYHDKAAFGSTLVNRPLDQKFVLDEMERLCIDPESFLHGLIDTSKTGLIGYSMGGYGAIITAGGGVTEAGCALEGGAPEGTLEPHLAGSSTHEALLDSRFKAIVSIAPWGLPRGMFDKKGLAGIRVPIFFIAGSVDEVVGYEDGPRKFFEDAVNVDRYLLTFENAGHNAAAPIPAPEESFVPVDHLDFVPFAHYADAVWDSLRMNNITQHFVAAYFGLHLKGDEKLQEYLDLTPV
ncbi:MAG: dienelactone hydrolase, partial [Alphaproteobacteria bacterium]